MKKIMIILSWIISIIPHDDCNTLGVTKAMATAQYNKLPWLESMLIPMTILIGLHILIRLINTYLRWLWELE